MLEDWEQRDLDRRADSLVAALGPDVEKLIDEVIDHWDEYATTLAGAKRIKYKEILRRRTRVKLGRRLLHGAIRFEQDVEAGQ